MTARTPRRLVLTNGRVYTQDAARPTAEALASIEARTEDVGNTSVGVREISFGLGSRSKGMRLGSAFSGKSEIVPRSHAFQSGGTLLASFDPL